MSPLDKLASLKLKIESFAHNKEKNPKEVVTVVTAALDCFSSLTVVPENKLQLEGFIGSLKKVDFESLPGGQDLKARLDQAVQVFYYTESSFEPVPAPVDSKEQKRRDFIEDILSLVIVNIFNPVRANNVTVRELEATRSETLKALLNLKKPQMTEEQKEWFSKTYSQDNLRSYLHKFSLKPISSSSELEKLAIQILQATLVIANNEILNSQDPEQLRVQLVLLTLPEVNEEEFKPNQAMLIDMFANIVVGYSSDPKSMQIKSQSISRLQNEITTILNNEALKGTNRLLRMIAGYQQEVNSIKKDIQSYRNQLASVPRERKRNLIALINMHERRAKTFQEKINASHLEILSLRHGLNKNKALAFKEALQDIVSVFTKKETFEEIPAASESKPRKSKERKQRDKPRAEGTKKKAPVEQAASSKITPPEQTTSSSSPKPVSSEISLEKSFLNAPKSIIADPRVNSWHSHDLAALRQSVRTTHAIKATDRTDQDLTEARRRHHLPGTEKLIASDTLREKYCYKTPFGWNMFGALETSDGKVSFGVIEHGIDESSMPQKLYHRFFKPIQELNSKEAYFKLDASNQGPSLESDKSSNDGWQIVGTTACVDSNETFRLDFAGENTRLHIFTLDYFNQSNSTTSKETPRLNRM